MFFCYLGMIVCGNNETYSLNKNHDKSENYQVENKRIDMRLSDEIADFLAKKRNYLSRSRIETNKNMTTGGYFSFNFNDNQHLNEKYTPAQMAGKESLHREKTEIHNKTSSNKSCDYNNEKNKIAHTCNTNECSSTTLLSSPEKSFNGVNNMSNTFIINPIRYGEIEINREFTVKLSMSVMGNLKPLICHSLGLNHEYILAFNNIFDANKTYSITLTEMHSNSKTVFYFIADEKYNIDKILKYVVNKYGDKVDDEMESIMKDHNKKIQHQIDAFHFKNYFSLHLYSISEFRIKNYYLKRDRYAFECFFIPRKDCKYIEERDKLIICYISKKCNEFFNEILALDYIKENFPELPIIKDLYVKYKNNISVYRRRFAMGGFIISFLKKMLVSFSEFAASNQKITGDRNKIVLELRSCYIWDLLRFLNVKPAYLLGYGILIYKHYMLQNNNIYGYEAAEKEFNVVFRSTSFEVVKKLIMNSDMYSFDFEKYCFN